MSVSQTTTFKLDHIAAQLEGLEETIIYRLIDRGQFALNESVYRAGAHHGFPGFEDHSLLDIRFRMQEEMDARFGRFLVPEERPFSDDLPPPLRKPPRADQLFPISDYAAVSQNQAILSHYRLLLGSVCAGDDDGHHGSSVECDVAALQAIARRIHYGSLYVAESKFLAEPELYAKHIRSKDQEELMRLLTRAEVEARILERVGEKLDRMQETVNTMVRRRLAPDHVMQLYRDCIIPLTKQGEVAYLFSRHL